MLLTAKKQFRIFTQICNQMRIFTWMLLLSWSLNAWSQSYTSTEISLEDGLSQSTIFTISQDPKGFLWFGTEDGLNRYDGYSFKVFKNEPFDSTSLADNQVKTLLTDREGRLWIGLMHRGISLYDPYKGEFRNFSHDPDNPYSVSSNNVTSLFQDLKGDIWVGTANGFNKVIQDKYHNILFERYYFKERKNAKGKSHYVRSIFEDGSGNLWIGTRNGLALFNRVDKHLVEVPVYPETKNWDHLRKNSKGVNALIEDRLGRLWLATARGLFRWDRRSDSWALFLENQADYSNEYFISDLEISVDGDLFIATMGNGLYLVPFDQKDNKYCHHWQHYSSAQESPIRLSSDLIRSLHLDHLNPDIMWIGHSTKGIEKLTRITSSFQTDYMDGPELKELMTSFVSGMLKSSKGDLWIATANGLVFQDTSGKQHLYQHDPRDPNSIKANHISTILEDQKGQIWVATKGGLDRVLYGENGKFIFEHCEFEEECNWPSLYSAYEDRDGYLYLAMHSGITVFHPETQSFWPCSYQPDPDRAKHIGYKVFDMLRDSQNRFWIGTSYGLIMFRGVEEPFQDLMARRPEVYIHNPRDITSIRNHTILCVTEDQNGDIWLGTFNGLLKVRDEGKKLYFQAFTEKQGLSNNVVYGIIEDPATKSLWMSTNNGLSKFYPDKMEFENFDSSDGLQSNEFNGQAYFRAEDGEMFFGGINGLTRFYPSSILRDNIPPQVWITSFTSIDNREHNLLYHPRKTIELNHQQNSFSLNFIALNYTNPTKNQYAYLLEGLHDTWIQCGESRQVNFSELPPGDYTFKVIGANGDGVWNRVGDSIQIHINPPYWQTLWFYVFLVVLLGLMFGIFHQYRVKTKVHRVMELERVRKNAAADFHDELGHKLTVISLFGEIVKKKLNGQTEILPQLNKIIENANSLYYSMKDLLWVLDPNKDSVYDLAILLKDFGDELFDKTGVDFRTQGIGPDMRGFDLPMDHKRHIVLIFKEVMNNALKHSDCAKAELAIDFRAQELKLEFRDDGHGFDPEQIRGGNGMQNLKTRAGKIGAKLAIDTSSKGTRIMLNCTV